MLGFRLPHRISRLTSFIDADSASESDAATLRFAMAPGVDGNFMRPEGFHTSMQVPGLRSIRRSLRLTWTDETTGDTHPRAESVISRAIEVQKLEAEHAAGVVLRGFELETRCDPDKQSGAPWNSNGMWPYRMAIEVGDIAVGADGVGRFELGVQMHRAWTPNKGGIPGIETKALNRRLDFELVVHYDVLTGPRDVVAFTPGDRIAASGRGHDRQGATEVATLQGKPGYPACVVGMTGFGFTLSAPTDKPRHKHLGRYITALGFRVRRLGYDAGRGEATIEHRARLWLPSTVVDAEVAYETRALLIQLGEGADVGDPQVATGSICSESSPQAPFFSRWKRCGGKKTGPAQTEDSVEL